VGTEVELHLILTGALDGVSGELIAPDALTRIKSLLYPPNRKLAGQISMSGRFGVS